MEPRKETTWGVAATIREAEAQVSITVGVEGEERFEEETKEITRFNWEPMGQGRKEINKCRKAGKRNKWTKKGPVATKTKTNRAYS